LRQKCFSFLIRVTREHTNTGSKSFNHLVPNNRTQSFKYFAHRYHEILALNCLCGNKQNNFDKMCFKKKIGIIHTYFHRHIIVVLVSFFFFLQFFYEYNICMALRRHWWGSVMRRTVISYLRYSSGVLSAVKINPKPHTTLRQL